MGACDTFSTVRAAMACLRSSGRERMKRAQLVCQHFENVSREALQKHQDLIREYVRGRHGVYALYRKGKLHYVGLARNLRSRLPPRLYAGRADYLRPSIGGFDGHVLTGGGAVPSPVWQGKTSDRERLVGAEDIC